MKTYKKLLESGKFNPVGFNPIELEKSIANLKVEKLAIEQTLKKLKGVEIISSPPVYIYQNPVKPRILQNTAIVGVVSLILGVFLAFVIEYFEKIKREHEK